MNERDHVLPDEIETLCALHDAAATLDGDLAPADGGWRLRLPRTPSAAVRLTGTRAFPLEVETPQQRLAIPACADAEEMADSLQTAILHKGSSPIVDLAGQELRGWVPISVESDRIALARTNQAARGWPSAAEVTITSGVAIVEVGQTITTGHDATYAALDHLLAWASRGVVLACRAPSSNGPAESSECDLCYRLATPTGMLTPARLADALYLLSARYRDIAPALSAMAEHPALADAYITLNRRSK